VKKVFKPRPSHPISACQNASHRVMLSPHTCFFPAKTLLNRSSRVHIHAPMKIFSVETAVVEVQKEKRVWCCVVLCGVVLCRVVFCCQIFASGESGEGPRGDLMHYRGSRHATARLKTLKNRGLSSFTGTGTIGESGAGDKVGDTGVLSTSSPANLQTAATCTVPPRWQEQP
jgi:hypothetical protein